MKCRKVEKEIQESILKSLRLCANEEHKEKGEGPINNFLKSISVLLGDIYRYKEIMIKEIEFIHYSRLVKEENNQYRKMMYSIQNFWEILANIIVSIRGELSEPDSKEFHNYFSIFGKEPLNNVIFKTIEVLYVHDDKLPIGIISSKQFGNIINDFIEMKNCYFDYMELRNMDSNKLSLEYFAFKEFCEIKVENALKNTYNENLEDPKNYSYYTFIDRFIRNFEDEFDLYCDDKVTKEKIKEMKMINFLLLIVNRYIVEVYEILCERLVDSYETNFKETDYPLQIQEKE